MKKYLLLVIGLVLSFNSIKGEIQINWLPYEYEENFDIFEIGGGLPFAWDDNSTMIGWYWTQSTLNNNNTITQLLFNDGSENQPNPYYFSSNGDQAMGAAAGNGTSYEWKLVFFNNNFLNITNINLSFALEQWNDNSLTPHSLKFYYRVDGFADDEMGWIPLSHEGLQAPHSSSLGLLDGNDPANRNLVSLTLSSTSLVINPGQRFWLRWEYPNNGASAHPALAIDDLKIDFKGEKVPIFAELVRPNTDFIDYKSKRGFKIKGRVGVITEEDDTKVTQVSYAIYRTVSGDFVLRPDVEYTKFARVKSVRKRSKLYRNDYRAVFKTGKRKNRAGRNLEGSAPLQLALKVEYTRFGLSNTAYFGKTLDPSIK